MQPAEGSAILDSESLFELSAIVTETAQVLFAAGSVQDTLASVVDLAIATIEGCGYAGISLLDGKVFTTSAHTDPIVTEVDSLQQRASEGPCLDAIAQGVVLYAED